MDIFSDDIDSILGTNALNENINENDLNDGAGSDSEQQHNRNEENDDGNDEGPDGDDGESAGKAVVVEPKRRTVRNPQPRLNIDRLKTDRGIHTIEEYYKDIRFLGKGNEAADLDNVMKRLEHWAHRLYPRFNFDDFISKTEKLGKSKQIQTHMHRYRTGMLDLDVNKRLENLSDDEGNGDNVLVAEPIDEFDDLIGQQIEKYKSAPPPKTPGHETTFDTVYNSTSTSSVSLLATPKFMNRNPVYASTPMSDIVPLDQAAKQQSPVKTLTSEQMAMIAENRRLAQERLKARREATMIKEAPTIPTIAESEEIL